jgi:hypothetical protein
MQGLGSKIKQGVDDSTKEADLSVASGLAGMIGGITSGISTINQTKKNVAELEKYGKVSDVALQAATSRPEQSRRRYVRPEDNLVTGANPLGKPSSLLAAENGAEIANTFAPNTIYTDMGYEPLSDSDKVKAFKKGGKLKKAEIGAMIGTANSIADLSRASGQIGGLLGSQWSGAGGETGGYSQALGGFGLLGGIAGGLLDAPMIKRKQQAQGYLNTNLGLIGMQSGMNSPHMENGGWMNPEYNPQVIAKFGDYSMDQLLAPPHDADMLRAGGHLKEYTPPSERAMYTGRNQMEYGGQMAMGGDLEVHRGQAETMSYNPFLPDGGETVMFRGPSHDDGGMPISYGQNGVEVEGGEPAVKLQDGGSPDGNLVVYGNMIIPEYGVAELGDKNAKGKKFKHYVADLSKIEAKQGKLIEKTTNLINNADTNDQFEKLSLNTGQANLIGATMKLKDIAEKKKTAAAVQNAILDTAKEMGVESDALAKGKIKYAKANDPYAEFGTKLSKAQDGKKVIKPKYDYEFENFINQAIPLEVANSYDNNNYVGGGSNFGTNNDKITNIDEAKEYYYKNYWSKVKDLPRGLRTRALQMAINTGDPYGELMVAGKEMSLDERRKAVQDADKLKLTGVAKDNYIQSRRFKENKKNIANIVKQYEKDPDTFLANLDAEQDRYYDSVIENNPLNINSDTRKDFYNDYIGLAKYAAKPYVDASGPREDYNYSQMFGRRLSMAEKKQKEAEFKKNDPVGYNKVLNNLNRQFVAERRMVEGDVPYPTEFVYTPLDITTPIAKEVTQPATSSGALTGTSASIPAPAPTPIKPVTSNTPAPTSAPKELWQIPKKERAALAKANGIKNYTGTKSQNMKLLGIINKPAPQPVAPILSSTSVIDDSGYVPSNDRVNMAPAFMPDAYAPIDMSNYVAKQSEGEGDDLNKKKDKSSMWNTVMMGVNSVLPFVRPSNQMTLEPSQLTGEMYAMSQNQEEPVFAQSYQPMLSQGINISLQDQLNEITSQSRAAERMAQGNPAALSMIASQAADAKNKVLGEQFRMNQGEAQRVAETNRQTMNEAAKMNLGLFDQQQQRASQARSNTKMQNIVALNSINDKIAKNKLENRQLSISENLYNYRFTPKGVAYNINPLQNFNLYGAPGSGTGQIPAGMTPTWESDDSGKPQLSGYKKKKEDKVTGRNGSIVKAIKGL